MFLISPGGNCVTPPPLRPWQLSLSLNKLEQLTVPLPHSGDLNSAFCHALPVQCSWWADCPHPPHRGELCSTSMATSFVGGMGSTIWPPPALDYVVPLRLSGPLCSSCCGCRFTQAEWGLVQQGAGRLCLHSIGPDVAESISVCSAKGKKVNGKTAAFPQADWWLCQSQPMPGLPWLLCPIKSSFKGHSLNSMSTLCVVGNFAG
jgi:hypothetical protein